MLFVHAPTRSKSGRRMTKSEEQRASDSPYLGCVMIEQLKFRWDECRKRRAISNSNQQRTRRRWWFEQMRCIVDQAPNPTPLGAQFCQESPFHNN
jgi:hypothetical protein